jgi:hypothetical protein
MGERPLGILAELVGRRVTVICGKGNRSDGTCCESSYTNHSNGVHDRR